MKYYKEVKVSEELPESTGYYKTSYGSRFFNLRDGQFWSIDGNIINHWLKPITREELLMEETDKVSQATIEA